MSKTIWDNIYRGHKHQEPKSARFAQVAAGIRAEAGAAGRVLLLGVTPSLSNLGDDLTAVDHNPTIVRTRWPGNTPDRRAVIADWLRMPFASGAFTTCVGDGSLNALTYPDGTATLYENLARVLRPGSRFVCRVYLTPDAPDSVDEVVATAWNRSARSLVYLRIRLGMAIVAARGDPNLPLTLTYKAFSENFPDRDRLAAATGWERAEIDKIDLYRDSTDVFSFPTRAQALAVVPGEFGNARLVPNGTYEFAERCPLLVMERR